MSKKMNDDELKAKIHEVVTKHFPISLTELGRLLGWGKISGSQTKRIRTILPGLEELLKKNIALKELEKPKTTPTNKTNIANKKPSKVADKSAKETTNDISSPYRNGSDYNAIYRILFLHKDGITRKELLKQTMTVTKKPENLCRFSIAVVTSIRKQEDGTFTYHKSALRGVDKYYVEAQPGGFLKLHLR